MASTIPIPQADTQSIISWVSFDLEHKPYTTNNANTRSLPLRTHGLEARHSTTPTVSATPTTRSLARNNIPPPGIRPTQPNIPPPPIPNPTLPTNSATAPHPHIPFPWLLVACPLILLAVLSALFIYSRHRPVTDAIPDSNTLPTTIERRSGQQRHTRSGPCPDPRQYQGGRVSGRISERSWADGHESEGGSTVTVPGAGTIAGINPYTSASGSAASIHHAHTASSSTWPRHHSYTNSNMSSDSITLAKAAAQQQWIGATLPNQRHVPRIGGYDGTHDWDEYGRVGLLQRLTCGGWKGKMGTMMRGRDSGRSRGWDVEENRGVELREMDSARIVCDRLSVSVI